jgi:hypothetical protein
MRVWPCWGAEVNMISIMLLEKCLASDIKQLLLSVSGFLPLGFSLLQMAVIYHYCLADMTAFYRKIQKEET